MPGGGSAGYTRRPHFVPTRSLSVPSSWLEGQVSVRADRQHFGRFRVGRVHAGDEVVLFVDGVLCGLPVLIAVVTLAGGLPFLGQERPVATIAANRLAAEVFGHSLGNHAE